MVALLQHNEYSPFVPLLYYISASLAVDVQSSSTARREMVTKRGETLRAVLSLSASLTVMVARTAVLTGNE